MNREILPLWKHLDPGQNTPFICKEIIIFKNNSVGYWDGLGNGGGGTRGDASKMLLSDEKGEDRDKEEEEGEEEEEGKEGREAERAKRKNRR